MPWKETAPVKERIKLILEVESGVFNFSEVCERYGVSRKTGYKWVRRYEQGGFEGLKDHSRTPHCCPHQTPQEVEDRIVALRDRHQDWGPLTLRMWLARHEPEVSWPAVSTIGDILQRKGKTKRRRRRPRPQPIYSGTKVHSDAPNEILTADFKGQFRTGDRRYCYPLTILDHYSRFSLCCQGLESTATAGAREQFERVFRVYGLPQAILTDNGTPFAGNGLRRWSRLSVWWIRLGIQPLLIQPGHPEQNGRHERFHRTLKQRTAIPPAADPQGQQRRFDRFRQEYNEQRPHQNLDGKTPAELYRPSSRSYPRKLPEVDYPGHYEIRLVSSSGHIKFQNRQTFLSDVLSGERVGLEEIEDGIWSLYLGTVVIGRWDEAQRKMYG